MSNSASLPVELQSATRLLQALEARSLGSLELLELLIARIERLDPALNAVVAADYDFAREAARAADDAPAAERGALHGLPITLKDAWEVVGMTASCGLPALEQHRPTRDADAVARLRAAGAIPFAKTNTPVLAADHQSYNPIYGATNNPWNPARTPGGSSGGAAAAVAAGFTPLELGSDIGGSIRCPSHFCGIYGHKSSFGIVPLRGHVPPMPGALVAPPLGIAGPMARSAVDLELALDVLVSAAELDRRAWQITVPASRRERLADFRVALWADQSAYSVDTRCIEAMQDFAQDLRRLGVEIDETARPEIDFAASDDLYVALLFRAISTGMPEDVLVQTEEAAREFGGGPRGYPERIARAVRLGYPEFEQLLEQQQHLMRGWARFFEGFDLILCPIMPTVAFAHDHGGEGPGHIAQYSRTVQVDGRPIPYLNGLQWPGLATVANLPATAIPTGRLIDGLPMGVQAIGPYLEDRTPLRFAERVEEALGGFRPPPSLR